VSRVTLRPLGRPGRLLAAALALSLGGCWRGEAAPAAHVREARRVEFDPADPGRLLVLEAGGDVGVWRVDGPGAPALEHRLAAAASDARFLPRGRGLVTGGADGTVKRWGLDGVLAWTVDAGAPLRALAVAPDRIAAAGADGGIRFVGFDGRPAATVATDAGPLLALAFSPSGEWLAAEGTDTRLRLWHRAADGAFAPALTFRKANKRYVRLLPNLLRHDIAWGWDRSLAFVPDGQSLVAADFRGAVRRWDVSGRPLGEPLRGPEKQHIRAVAIAPDGRLAAALLDGSLLLWPPQGGTPVTIAGHDGAATSIAFSPDGRRLASAGIDGTVVLWSADGKQLGALPSAK
jgi:WD40 repeat protein